MTLLLLKFVHVLAAIVYFGNLTAACLWNRYASRIADPGRRAAVIEGVDRADKRLTVPGAAVLVLSGLALVTVSGRSFAFHWIVTAIVLSVIILWLLRWSAAPIKRALLVEAKAAATETGSRLPDASPEKFVQWRRRLDLAWVLSVIMLALMIWRPV